MSSPESQTASLATSTLVRLYLGQAHFDKAQELAMTLVERDPEDGEALALLDRCRRAVGCRLRTRFAPGRLSLHWDLRGRVLPPEQASLHVHLFDASAPGAKVEHREIRCHASAGKVTIPLTFENGACTSYLCLDDESGRQGRVLAVGRVHRWRRGNERRVTLPA